MNENTTETTLPVKRKKKILLISDDIRMNSGVSTVARTIVLGTTQKYEWVQMAGAISHPEAGKIIDLSEATDKMLNTKGSYVKLYATNGYGDENSLFQVMGMEKPDVVLLVTDPRFFGHIFQLERQIRKKIPIIYNCIWDCPPYPMWNKANAYECCDLLMAISKQTDRINLHVTGPENCFRIDGWYNDLGELQPWENKKEKETLICQ